MPISSNTKSLSFKPPKPGAVRRSDYVCPIRFTNTLPDVPFDPKFLKYPFEAGRFVEYQPTSLEKDFQYQLHMDQHLGIQLDLVTPELYAAMEEPIQLDDADIRLLDDGPSDSDPASEIAKRRARPVSWLRKATDHIATESSKFGGGDLHIGQISSAEAKRKQILKEQVLYRDKESQLRAINDTFRANQKPITEHHLGKKGVNPVAILPLFPDMDMWKFFSAQVVFDSDPAPVHETHEKAPQEITEKLSQAVIRGMKDEAGEQFVAYYLPTDETVKRRRVESSGDEPGTSEEKSYKYELVREYNWHVRNRSSQGFEEAFFFVLKDKEAVYNELETKVRLTKRKKMFIDESSSMLVVQDRPFTERELQLQDVRMEQLSQPLPHVEEEEAGAEAAIDDDHEQPPASPATQKEEDKNVSSPQVVEKGGPLASSSEDQDSD